MQLHFKEQLRLEKLPIQFFGFLTYYLKNFLFFLFLALILLLFVSANHPLDFS